MLLDQDGPLERTLGELALLLLVGPLWCCTSLLLDTDEHVGKEEAFQLLPRLAISAHTNGAMKSKFAKSMLVSRSRLALLKPVWLQEYDHTVEIPDRANSPRAHVSPR